MTSVTSAHGAFETITSPGLAEREREGRSIWIERNFIRAKAQSAIVLTVSEYIPIQVYSDKRSEIQEAAPKKLDIDFATCHLILRQIDIREVFYNPQDEESIDNKKLAEQEALRLIEVTKQKLEQLKQAEGKSRALHIKGQSISNNPKIIELELDQQVERTAPHHHDGERPGSDDRSPEGEIVLSLQWMFA